MAANLVRFDTTDDKTEIAALLRRLPPHRRLAFLDWCCAHASLKSNPRTHPVVTPATRRLAAFARWDTAADERLTVHVWTDVWNLASGQYRFDLDAALLRLVDMVRRQ